MYFSSGHWNSDENELCPPLPPVADLFLHFYENEFLDSMIRSGHRKLAKSFNLCYPYISIKAVTSCSTHKIDQQETDG